MRKRIIIIAIIILLPFLIFWAGRFHFSEFYFIGRDIPFERINRLNVDWKYSGGDRITGQDFLEFDDYWTIKKDTLYMGEQPVAKVISLVKRCFIDYELKIQSFDKQETGYYVSK
jgi:hypothetical protein